MKKLILCTLVIVSTSAFGQNFGSISSGGFSNTNMSCTVGNITVIETSVTASVNENETLADATIFPNPVAEGLNIVVEGENSITVIDINGSITFSTVGSNVNVDMTSYASGIYLVNVSNDKGSKTYKVIKK